ncbi:response regulator [Spartinivicinus ruber]|uniref:response regulator n=1 Tax=Spartinivicinus ruber TaxID=2683272 RepID=UPI0013D51A26|nr:response regulator [Spartinivicinus ruber]
MNTRGQTNKKCRIILIEDCEEDALILKYFIRNAKLNVEEIVHFDDGMSAYEFLDSEIVDDRLLTNNLVILDLNLPKMTGQEILENLQKNKKNTVVNIIILSGSENPADKEKCFSYGAKAYYVKPWHMDGYKEFTESQLRDEIHLICSIDNSQ